MESEQAFFSVDQAVRAGRGLISATRTNANDKSVDIAGNVLIIRAI
jgi:hypothetical protein